MLKLCSPVFSYYFATMNVAYFYLSFIHSSSPHLSYCTAHNKVHNIGAGINALQIDEAESFIVTF